MRNYLFKSLIKNAYKNSTSFGKVDLVAISAVILLAGIFLFAFTSSAKSCGLCFLPGKKDKLAQKEKTASNYKTLNVNIQGMTCSACAKRIATALENLDGVAQTSITEEEKGGTVRYDPRVIDEPTILKTINNIGFKAEKRQAIDK